MGLSRCNTSSWSWWWQFGTFSTAKWTGIGRGVPSCTTKISLNCSSCSNLPRFLKLSTSIFLKDAVRQLIACQEPTAFLKHAVRGLVVSHQASRHTTFPVLREIFLHRTGEAWKLYLRRRVFLSFSKFIVSSNKQRRRQVVTEYRIG